MTGDTASTPARDFTGYGACQPDVTWPDGACVAINLVVNYEEGSEYSFSDGDGRNEGQGELPYPFDPQYRDLGIESTYEYGSRAGVWRLLRLFDEYNLSVTFFACAVALERNRAVAEAIRMSGHEACGHGFRWTEPWLFRTREEERKHLELAIESIRQTCGERPRGWYSRYSPSVHTRELLVAENGFLYDSDAYNDDLPYFTVVNDKRHLVVPYTLSYNDGRIIGAGYGAPTAFVDYCTRGLDELWREGANGQAKMMTIGLHPRWMGQAARVSALREIIEYALTKGDVWFARRIDIANWWLDHYG